MAESVLPERVLAIDVRSLWNDVRHGRVTDPVAILEQLARATDTFAMHAENARRGIPVPGLSEMDLATLLNQGGAWEFN